jgi:hypothetical protein
MEGMHVVGGILSKISINCVLIYMLCIYTFVYVLWVLPVYVACILLLLFPHEYRKNLRSFVYVYKFIYRT